MKRTIPSALICLTLACQVTAEPTCPESNAPIPPWDLPTYEAQCDLGPTPDDEWVFNLPASMWVGEKLSLAFELDLTHLTSLDGSILVGEMSRSSASTGFPIDGDEVIRLWVEGDPLSTSTYDYELWMEYGTYTLGTGNGDGTYIESLAVYPAAGLMQGPNDVTLVFARRPNANYQGRLKTKADNTGGPEQTLLAGGQELRGVTPTRMVLGWLDDSQGITYQGNFTITTQ